MFDKDGASKLPLATSSNHQMKSKASKYIHQPSKGIVIREGPPKKATVVSSTSTEGGISTSMILHVSTYDRCNSKKGWTKFAAQMT
uniref:Uncharacterized protein n=1 Tax=Oryza rufipogon TaxID=4529 RepID=A0A0E0MXA8_ORYRU